MQANPRDLQRLRGRVRGGPDLQGRRLHSRTRWWHAALLLVLGACGPRQGCIQAGPEVNCSDNNCGVNGVLASGDLGIASDQSIRLRVDWCEMGTCGSTAFEASVGDGQRAIGGGRRIPVVQVAGDGAVCVNEADLDAGADLLDADASGWCGIDEGDLIRVDDLTVQVDVEALDLGCGNPMSCPDTWHLAAWSHSVPYEQTEEPPPVSYRLVVTDLNTDRVLVDFEGEANWKHELPRGCPKELNRDGNYCWHAYQEFDLLDGDR